MDNVIAKITDEDLGLPKKKLVDPDIRYASRGIIINEEGKVAIFCKKKKNEYKLPGGGIIPNEDKVEAFIREIREETGCEITNINELGITIEEKGETDFRQISYVFMANVLKDTKILHLTQKEQDEGGELLWLDFNDAYQLISQSINKIVGSKYESKYRTLFVVRRDALILKKYMESKKISSEKMK